MEVQMPKGYATLLSVEDEENIRKLYLKENVSIHDLRKIYKVSENRIKSIVINVRSSHEVNKIRCEKRPTTISNEQKLKISNKLKLAHIEGRHPGWSHINNNKTRRSFPEKIFFDQLKAFNLLDTYTFMEKMPFGRYTLDFALIDMKIDIEIDGQQHFRDDSAINHDIERDRFVKNKGWRVYRIAYKEMQKI
jgi:very-short-patch-repair endonuclease